LRLELDADLPAMIADRVQLQQVILNLLRNAADAMSEVDDRPREVVISTVLEPAGDVLVSVRDVGISFDPKTADKLFEAFYTTKDGGMGMGLSVCRAIVEQHKGRLWAEPNEGAGSIFSFVIPRPASAA